MQDTEDTNLTLQEKLVHRKKYFKKKYNIGRLDADAPCNFADAVKLQPAEKRRNSPDRPPEHSVTMTPPHQSSGYREEPRLPKYMGDFLPLHPGMKTPSHKAK